MTSANRFQGVNSLGEPFVIYANEALLGENDLGTAIRFTAGARTKTVYGWNFNNGHHADTSRTLNFNDQYSSLDFLRGAAEKIDGKFVFVASDFFKSFKGRLVGDDRRFLTALFSKDWSWVDQYILVTDRLELLKEGFGL
jgi:hypothetical protein